jgi:regulator of sigma E protease
MGGIISASPENNGRQEILITDVVPNSPAAMAGLIMGDILIAGNGTQFQTEDEASNLIKANADNPIVFTVLRDGEQLELTITPRMNDEAGRPLIGVGMCGGCEFKLITSPVENLQYAAKLTALQIYGLATMPVRLIQGTIPREQGRLVGLKGIFDIMQQSVSNDVEASQSNTVTVTPSNAPNPYNKPVQTLSMIAMLSISLGIFNLFPFPALDGGRIIFVIPEILFRRRVPHKFENLVHGLGMAFLLVLMLYINVRDFVDPAIINYP